MNKEPQVFLKHILESINLIEDNVSGMSQEKFLENTPIQDAVMRRLEIIGEAVKNLPETLKQQTPNVPWQDIADMRNKLIHEYFGVDIKLVWNTIQNDLPSFKEQIQKILKNISPVSTRSDNDLQIAETEDLKKVKKIQRSLTKTRAKMK